MPTQRPFFANFFSAFRARSSPTFQAKSSTTTGAISPSILSASAHVSTTIATATSASAPRNITTKTASDTTGHGNNNATISQPIKTASTSPFGATALTSGSPGTAFYRRPPSPSPHGHNLALSPPGHTNPIARGRQRRDSGSSNSSGGFMEAMGTEKWYVGGRTATGSRPSHSLAFGRTRWTSSGNKDGPRTLAATCSQSLPWLVSSGPCKFLHIIRHRDYTSAHAALDSSFEDRYDGKVKEEEPHTGNCPKPLPAEIQGRVQRDRAPIHHYNLLNIRGLVRKLLSHIRENDGIAIFNDFKLWDDVVPILAARLGLRHFISTWSDTSCPRGARTKRRRLAINTIDERATHLHVLTIMDKNPPNFEDVEESLVEVLRDHIFKRNVDLWLQDFRENFRRADYPVWKVFMLVCKNSPPAMPRLEIVPANHQPVTGSDETKSEVQSVQLKLINERYDISIVQPLDANITVGEVLNVALLDYLEAIHRILPTEADFPFRFDPGSWDPGQFVGRGFSALGWGDLKFEEVGSEEFLPSAFPNDLWQIKLSTQRHGQLDISTIWHDKKLARLLAILHACNVLKDHLQTAYESGRLMLEEYQTFAQYWNKNNPEFKQLAVVTPDPANYSITVNGTIIINMLETLRALVQAGFRSTYHWISAESAGLGQGQIKPTPIYKNHRLDQLHYRAYWRRRSHPPGDALHLPVRNEKTSTTIKEAIENSDITIITAATGSGKTTQVPQIILDEYIAAQNGSMCTIVCTQPRRVSAISVANRVASERYQSLGVEIGYKVRFDPRPTQNACGITYMTSGYLLRLLEVDPLNVLNRHSHIILDEVHARDVDTDLILANVKNYLGKRTVANAAKMPKIILMSASIDAGFFQSYFEELGSDIEITAIDVPGKMYDVEHKQLDHLLAELRDAYPTKLDHLMKTPEIARYVAEQINFQPMDEVTTNDENQVGTKKPVQIRLPNQDLFVPIPLVHLMIVQLLTTTSSGDILVFLPGLGEIDALEVLLQHDTLSQFVFSGSEQYRIFKLHSALYQTNYDVFNEIPAGCRRIVLATNIAETSITLPNVKFVIDTGLSRQTTFDQVTQSGTFGLQWISKAEVMQRKGRAGRTQTGVYYGLYSQARYDAMSNAPTPEILRMGLDQLVLRSSSNSASRVPPQYWPKMPGVEDVRAGHVLLTTPSPPEVSFVAAAARQSHYIHALTVDGKPTPMGLVLSRFPMDPTAAKTVLLGMVFRCLDATLISGALREDSPLMYDPAGIGGTAERRRKLAKGTDDDRLADSQAFFLYDRARQQKDSTTAERIEEEFSIRYDAYCEYAQIAEQAFDTIQPMIGLSGYDEDSYEDDDMAWPLFPTTPPALNTNSTNADLVKALAFSTSGTRFACWNHKNWRSQLHPRVLPHPKSVNHNGSRRTILAQRLRRENGDLLSYAAMRTIPKDKYPWLHDTSAVTPLMAILFGESVSFVEKDSAFIINDWVKYEIGPVNPDQDVQRTAKIIWEYRKALDRFVAHIMQMISLEPDKIVKVQTGGLNIEDFNVYFQQKDNPIRKLVVDSVIKVLAIDAKDRKDRAVVRALEYESLEPTVAKDIQEKGDLEGLIELIVERGRSGAARDATNTKSTKTFRKMPGPVPIFRKPD